MSRHAARRAKDRSIPQSIVDALLDFGDRAPAGAGAELCSFNGHSWRRYAAYLGHEAVHFERYRRAYVVVASDGDVITVGWRS